MEDSNVRVDKIVINVDGTKVPLSMEQAKKLREILNEMFGKEVVREVMNIHHHDWIFRPYVYYDIPRPAWTDNVIYCSSNTALECKL